MISLKLTHPDILCSKGRVEIYPGRDHRQGATFFLEKKEGVDFFSEKNRGAETFLEKKLGGVDFFRKILGGEDVFYYKFENPRFHFSKKSHF